MLSFLSSFSPAPRSFLILFLNLFLFIYGNQDLQLAIRTSLAPAIAIMRPAWPAVSSMCTVLWIVQDYTNLTFKWGNIVAGDVLTKAKNGVHLEQNKEGGGGNIEKQQNLPYCTWAFCDVAYQVDVQTRDREAVHHNQLPILDREWE